MAEGQSYQGKSSPWWYDAPQFHELWSASGAARVRELVARLDGCTGGRAGEIVAEAGLGRMACSALSREQAVRLLEVTRDNSREVKPGRLGAVGPGQSNRSLHRERVSPVSAALRGRPEKASCN